MEDSALSSGRQGRCARPWRWELLSFAVMLLSMCPPGLAIPEHRVAREPGTRHGSFFYHVNDGFHYHLSHSHGESMYFRCVQYTRGCRGRAVYHAVEGFVHTTAHVHRPNLLYPHEMALRRNIITRCEALQYVPYQRVILEEGQTFPEVVGMVTYSRMRTPMRNARLQNFPDPARSVLELTGILRDPQYRALSMTHDGEDNIYGGSITDVDGSHHVLFMSDRMLERARHFSVLHGDGTFRSVPRSADFASQLFCLVGVWNHHIISLGWVLMTSLSQVAYTAVFQYLCGRLGPNIQLTRVISDFETAQQNAWQAVFNVHVQGCLWHLCRAFIEQVAVLSLIPRMRRIEPVRRIIRLTMALALLPENLIVRGFRIIMEHARNEGNYIFRIVRRFLNFVWVYWIRRPWRRERMCVFGSHQRTNNACECQNRVLRGEVGTHSNVYLFVAGLVRLEQRAHNIIVALEQGRRVNRGRRRSSVFNDHRIRLLSEDLLNPPGPNDATILRFLEAASHTMDNMVEELLIDREGARARQR